MSEAAGWFCGGLAFAIPAATAAGQWVAYRRLRCHCEGTLAERDAALARERAAREVKHAALNELNAKHLALQALVEQLQREAAAARHPPASGWEQWAASRHELLDGVRRRVESILSVGGDR